MTLKHFLDLSDVTAHTVRDIVDEARRRKEARAGLPNGTPDADQPLTGKLLALVFDKPSTRTRVSFDLAMRQLGGDTLMLNHNDMQLGRGEPLSDTAKVLSRYVDAIMVRTGPHENLTELAAEASVSVINGLTAYSHPCQILADILTIEEHRGPIKGQKIAWLGDGNNVSVSWIHAASLLDFELHLAVPENFRPPEDVLSWAAERDAKIVFSNSPEAAVDQAIAVNTDCWVSMSDNPEEAAARAKAFEPYRVTEALMNLSDNGVFLHCLPAYRGNEVEARVIDGPQSVVFDEAENRNHIQKAILLWCFEG